MNRLSVYILCKNEESNIINCLQSIVDKVEPREIIILDTGSTDKTLEKVMEWCGGEMSLLDKLKAGYGICIFGKPDKKVHHPNIRIMYKEWNDSFADMRNYAVSKCIGDYVLAIDADETVQEFSFVPGSDYYESVCILHSNGKQFPTNQVRLFRNSKDIYYTRKVHSTIEDSLVGKVKGECNIVTLHPELSEEELQLKAENNIRKFTEMLSEEPENDSSFYHLANCYFHLKRYNEARDFGVMGLRRKLNNEVKAVLCNMMYVIYTLEDNPLIAQYYLGDSLKYLSEQIMARLYMLNLMKSKGREDLALQQYEIIKEINLNKKSRLPGDTYYSESDLKEITKCQN